MLVPVAGALAALVPVSKNSQHVTFINTACVRVCVCASVRERLRLFIQAPAFFTPKINLIKRYMAAAAAAIVYGCVSVANISGVRALFSALNGVIVKNVSESLVFFGECLCSG